MKHVIISLLLIIQTVSTHAAIHGENNIWAAPDGLKCQPWSYNASTGICSDSVDKQLSNLIKRTGMTYAAASQGTALLIGKNCDRVIGTAHTINHINGKQRAPGQAVFYRNVYEKNEKIHSENRQPILLENNDRTPITDLTDRNITKLQRSAKDLKLSNCSKTPVLTATQLKKNLDNIDSCIIVSFNQDLGSRDISKRNTMTLRTHNGLKQVNTQTRGITSCHIQGFAHDGMIETNCDSIYASSGSPFFCKIKGKEWKLTGTLVADTCYGYNNYNNCLNPAVIGRGDHETLMLPIDEKLNSQLRHTH